MEESPITAAISHDPIANSSMIQPEKNDRRDATLRLSRNRNSSEYDSASFSLSAESSKVKEPVTELQP